LATKEKKRDRCGGVFELKTEEQRKGQHSRMPRRSEWDNNKKKKKEEEEKRGKKKILPGQRDGRRGLTVKEKKHLKKASLQGTSS